MDFTFVAFINDKQIQYSSINCKVSIIFSFMCDFKKLEIFKVRQKLCCEHLLRNRIFFMWFVTRILIFNKIFRTHHSKDGGENLNPCTYILKIQPLIKYGFSKLYTSMIKNIEYF